MGSKLRIRPVSDLRNHYSDIEDEVNSGEPVFLTKNGYGSMVVMSLDSYSHLTDDVELALDEADKAAAISDLRLTDDEVFSHLKERFDA